MCMATALGHKLITEIQRLLHGQMLRNVILRSGATKNLGWLPYTEFLGWRKSLDSSFHSERQIARACHSGKDDELSGGVAPRTRGWRPRLQILRGACGELRNMVLERGDARRVHVG